MSFGVVEMRVFDKKGGSDNSIRLSLSFASNIKSPFLIHLCMNRHERADMIGLSPMPKKSSVKIFVDEPIVEAQIPAAKKLSDSVSKEISINTRLGQAL